MLDSLSNRDEHTNDCFVGTTMERPTVTARRSIVANYDEPEHETHYNDAQPALDLHELESVKRTEVNNSLTQQQSKDRLKNCLSGGQSYMRH